MYETVKQRYTGKLRYYEFELVSAIGDSLHNGIGLEQINESWCNLK
jgi:hypothetical protein